MVCQLLLNVVDLCIYIRLLKMRQAEYELGIYPMQEGDLIEIDDFSELCDLDPSYCGYEAQGQEKSEEK